MKSIKHTRQKDILLSILMVVFVLLLATGIPAYFYTGKQAELNRYDIMEACESVSQPVFSVPEGIYDQPFELEMNATPDCEIYYTTDGSIPTVQSHRYSKRIYIDPHVNLNRELLYIPTSLVWNPPYGRQNHCTTVRARCFKAGTGYSAVKNVIYSTPDIKQHGDFNVVNILLEPDSLFAPEKGIYVLGEKYYSKRARIEIEQQGIAPESWMFYPANFHQRGKRWTRPATFILMNRTGKTLFEQNINICINGMASRAYPEKSLRITPDSRTATTISYPFFDSLTSQPHKVLLLRNSGNDTESLLFRDAMIHRMADSSQLDLQAYAPAVLYINGNYWGIHNIREKQEENYLAEKYGSSLENISMLDFYKNLTLYFGEQSSVTAFEKLLNFIRHNSLADSSNYSEVCTQIDVDNFIDYMIHETFFGNMDWPDNNVRFYRFSRQTDKMKHAGIDAGKWRWLFFDTDYSILTEPSINMFERLRSEYPQYFVTQIFFGLMDNASFREKFITRYDFLVRNCFTAQRMLEQVDIFEKRYRHEITRQIARWRKPGNIQFWNSEVENIREFLRMRPQIVLEQMNTL